MDWIRDIKNGGKASAMFGGNDMTKMMKQMGVDVDELEADKVEVTIGDRKLVFRNPDLSKIEAQGQEIFQLQGNYEEVEEVNEEDVDLVVEKTGASREEAQEALKEAGDVAGAVMELQ